MLSEVSAQLGFLNLHGHVYTNVIQSVQNNVSFVGLSDNVRNTIILSGKLALFYSRRFSKNACIFSLPIPLT